MQRIRNWKREDKRFSRYARYDGAITLYELHIYINSQWQYVLLLWNWYAKKEEIILCRVK